MTVLDQKYRSQSKRFSRLQRYGYRHVISAVLSHTVQTPIKWEAVDVTPQLKDGRTVIPDAAIESVKKNYVALKGPLAVSNHHIKQVY